MSNSSIPQVIHDYFAASRSDDKVEGMVACFATDALCHDPAEGPAIQGQEGLRQFFQGITDLFATVGLTTDFISVNGAEVAVKWSGQGVGKNGRSVSFEGIDWFEVNADGQIQAMKGYWNPAAVITELTADS